MAKPTVDAIWDSTQANISLPGATREASGWQAPAGVPEKPPYQVFNYWQNIVYLWQKYLNEQGITEWDTTITYAIGAYVVASDNLLYRALISQAGNTPVGDATNWHPVGDLVNTLVSTDTTRGLTAAQGKILKDAQATATTATEGLVELATPAENIAGTSDAVVPTSKGIREAFNVTGSAPVYACRAWVNFNGTGVVAIRAAGNVSSITDNGVGDYTATFLTAMPDADYAVSGACSNSNNYFSLNPFTGVPTTADITFKCSNYGGTGEDAVYVSVIIHR